MESKFNRLKNGLRIKILLALIITVCISAVFLVFGILHKNALLYMLFALAYLLIFPILIFVLNIGFDGKKVEIITESVLKNLEKPFNFSLYKKVDGDEIEILKLHDVSQYFSVSSVFEAEEDDKRFISYCVKFEDLKKKRYIGKIIHLHGYSNKNLVNNDYLYKDNAYKIIKEKNEDFYLFVAKQYKKKEYINYSLEPLDFKSYKEYEERIRKEISFYKMLIE